MAMIVIGDRIIDPDLKNGRIARTELELELEIAGKHEIFFLLDHSSSAIISSHCIHL